MPVKIKVVHFIHGLNTGGAETLVKDYALLMDREQFDITVLCQERFNSPYEKILESAGIHVIYLSDDIHFFKKKDIVSKLRRKILLYKGCQAYIKEIDPEIIHYHLTLSSSLRYAQIKNGCRIVLTVHNEPQKLWFNRNIQSWKDYHDTKWLISRYPFKMIALHNSMKKELEGLFPGCEVLVLNNGINFERFNVKESKSEIRKELGIHDQSFIIGHVGRFCWQKNQGFLLDIFYEIRRKNGKAFLLMVGEGPMKPEIEQKIQNLSLTDSVRILSNRTDIPQIMKAMDVFAFPSVYEGLGIVLIEAQKMRLPCVISDSIPKAADISNLVSRLSLTQNTLEEWAKMILAQNTENREVIYDNIEDWDMKKICKKLEDIYLYDWGN